jgi:cytochrome bd-type quinol oxidase subunit 2
MFLDYLSLFILLAGLTLVFYTAIYIHDLPHAIAKRREHPHEEAIHVACWLSLLTLHAMWPIVYIWAVSHKKSAESSKLPTNITEPSLAARVAELERRLRMGGATGNAPVDSQPALEAKS